ncbi:Reverse transcriptase zinc-binding domain - like 9 [Theobroma cacao]|nr:Reverse transcriptase zinc-binding domain - like 9 [Theobroma cacao]
MELNQLFSPEAMKMIIPYKVKYFGWTALKQVVPVRQVLAHKGITSELGCCVCDDADESVKKAENKSKLKLHNSIWKIIVRSKVGIKFRRKKERYLCMSNIKVEAIHLTGNSLKKHALSLPEIRRSILNML